MYYTWRALSRFYPLVPSPRRYYSAANLLRSRANETFTITGLLYLFSPSSAGNDVTRRVCRHVLVTDADTVDLIKRNWVDVEEDDDRETTTTTKQTADDDDDDAKYDVKYLLFIRVSAGARADLFKWIQKLRERSRARDLAL